MSGDSFRRLGITPRTGAQGWGDAHWARFFDAKAVVDRVMDEHGEIAEAREYRANAERRSPRAEPRSEGGHHE